MNTLKVLCKSSCLNYVIEDRINLDFKHHRICFTDSAYTRAPKNTHVHTLPPTHTYTHTHTYELYKGNFYHCRLKTIKTDSFVHYILYQILENGVNINIFIFFHAFSIIRKMLDFYSVKYFCSIISDQRGASDIVHDNSLYLLIDKTPERK